jgi:hypothetical protein
MLVTRRVSEEASEWYSISSATVDPAFRAIVISYHGESGIECWAMY